jgi:hypothetical protein
MTNGDFIRSMSDADIRENFTQLLCEFVQRAVAGAENIASTASRTG